MDFGTVKTGTTAILSFPGPAWSHKSTAAFMLTAAHSLRNSACCAVCRRLDAGLTTRAQTGWLFGAPVIRTFD